MTSETDISRGIIEALRATGWRVIRVNSGKVKVSGGYMQLAPAGTPDLLVFGKVSSDGRAIWGWLESKMPIGKLSEKQIEFQQFARAKNINVATVRSRQEALDAVKGWN